MDPAAYPAPIDHEWAEEQGLSMEEVAELAGRSFEAPTYFLPQHEDEFATDIQEVGWSGRVEAGLGVGGCAVGCWSAAASAARVGGLQRRGRGASLAVHQP